MEARDIAMIAYELFRVKEDRDCMFYEDQLSLAARAMEEGKQKIRKLKQALYEQKKMYELLVQKVTEVGAGKFTVSNNAYREAPSSSAAREPRPAPPPSHEEVVVAQETAWPSSSFSNALPAPALSRSNSSDSSTSTASTRTADSPLPTTRLGMETSGKPRAWMSTSDDASRLLGLHSRAAPVIDLVSIPEDTSLARKRIRLAYRSAIPTGTDGSANGNNAQNSGSEASSNGGKSRRRARSRPEGTTLSCQPARSRPEMSNRSAVQRPCIEVIRNRAERAAIPGFSCFECENFYRTMLDQGIINEENRKDFLQNCSRHKSRWTPPSTPDGFWDLTVNTPPEWKTS